jgi:bifunctional ADP-heptose synthase (sugar kinase/adenylyltransferase)
MKPMLTLSKIETILTDLPRRTIGVVGDLFLDQYFDLDDRLTEPSLETGLPAYQATGLRHNPGAAGTIVNNLLSLGVGRVLVLSCIGADVQGLELTRALEQRGAKLDYLFTSAERFTPTYLKPLLHRPDAPPRELNRLDLKNRTPMPRALETRVLAALPALWEEADALLVSDQVSEPECGVITTGVRARLQVLGLQKPEKLLLADSRERVGLFRNVWLKPNRRECLVTLADGAEDVTAAVRHLVQLAQRPVFCTQGGKGILLGQPNPDPKECRLTTITAFPISGPVDSVGAGDSTSSGIACAFASGTSLEEAAMFGCLVASVTVQQLGTTGTATPTQVRQRWREVQNTPQPR